MHVPKSIVVGFLIAVGCVIGWMFAESVSAAADPVLRAFTPVETSVPPALPPVQSSSVPPVGLLGVATTSDSTLNITSGTPVVVGSAETSSSMLEITAAQVGTPDAVLVGSAETRRSSVDIAVEPDSSIVLDRAAPPSPVTIPGVVASSPAVPTNPTAPAAPAVPTSVPAVPQPAAVVPGLPSVPQIAGAPPGTVAPAPPNWPHAGYVASPVPMTIPASPLAPQPLSAQSLVQLPEIVIPPFLAEPIFTPLPGALSRGVSFMEWESYRVDVMGSDITVIADDSNFFRNRDGKLNGNTGDTDASGLNVTDVTGSIILGTESADEAPYQTVAAALVDLASEEPGGGLGSDPDDDEDEDSTVVARSAVPLTPVAPSSTTRTSIPVATATAIRTTTDATAAGQPGSGVEDPSADEEHEGDEDSPDDGADDTGSDPGDVANEEWDFPYLAWVEAANPFVGTAVNTDEGTTLASGNDALVIGSDGYDDDDIRVAGSNITVVRDDGNVVVGGTGDVNAQVGDSEQGAVIMDVHDSYIEGGGAY